MKSLESKKLNILIMGFNRSDLIESSLKRLSNLSFINIWLSIDGPRNNNADDLKEHELIKVLVEKFKIDKRNVRFGNVNLGCRKGVIKSISWYFKNVESGIILEDDIEINETYISLIKEFLMKYKSFKNIASISSHFSPQFVEQKSSYINFYLLSTCRVWGWATWKNEWENFKEFQRKLQKMNLVQLFFYFPKEYRSLNNTLLIWKCLNGIFDTWDYEWNFYHLKNNKKSITPNKILCINHGFRNDATHTTQESAAPWSEMNSFELESNIFVQKIKETSLEINNTISEECGFNTKISKGLETMNLLKFLLKKLIRKLQK